MSDDFNWYPEEEERPSGPRPGRVLFIAVAVVVIVGLLGTAIGGLAWFILTQSGDTAAFDTGSQVAESTTETRVATAMATVMATDEVPAALPVATETPAAGMINRIAFVNDDGQIETTAPDGSNSRTLTDTPQTFQFPAWSPDGQYLAAVGGDATGSAVYLIHDEESAEPQRLYFSGSQSPFYLYWSPDNQTISFLANHPSEEIGLHLVSVNGEDGDRLLATGQPFYWNWAASGRHLLIHTGFAGDDARLAFIESDGDGSGDNIADPGFFQAPGISADGRYWAYAEVSRSASQVVVDDTESDERHQERHAGLAAMGWSPTANQLAFISSATATGASFVGPLRLIHAETGEVRVLSRDTVLAFFWSPNGRYIAYISVTDDADGDINVRAPARGQGSRLAKPAQQPGLPFFNLFVVDVTTGEGRQLTRFRPTPLFVAQFLPFFDQYALSHRIWSPASDALVLPMDENGTNQIVVVFLNGQTRTLTEGTSAFWSHQ